MQIHRHSDDPLSQDGNKITKSPYPKNLKGRLVFSLSTASFDTTSLSNESTALVLVEAAGQPSQPMTTFAARSASVTSSAPVLYLPASKSAAASTNSTVSRTRGYGSKILKP
jgi:hypothetical protein